MILRALVPAGLTALLFCSCTREPAVQRKLTIAAAANLVDVFKDIGGAFQKKSGTEVVFVYGSTAQLAQQIDNGAPFDLFAAADTEHIDQLVARGKLVGSSRAVYASGQLALWIPGGDGAGVLSLKDLAMPVVRYVSIAQPELAPYGRASVEALKNSNLWDPVKAKVIYANNINQAKQMADSGNADAAFTAYSLVIGARGIVLKVDPKLYTPIDQAVAIVASSSKPQLAGEFRAFLLGPEGREILTKYGYLLR
jgi:molybdate transport system substrate-binding protein